MKSARILGPNEPLAISESETPRPQGNQVLVKVKSVGVCHSDLHLWEGGYDLGDGQFMKVTDVVSNTLLLLGTKLLVLLRKLVIVFLMLQKVIVF